MTDTPPRIGLAPLFLKFLGFGCLAFGGPVAQIAMIRRELVEREGWITGARFNRLLAVMQILPGPEAHELCVHLGVGARGRIGGLLAGLGFMLPGTLLMLATAWLYVRFGVGQAWAPAFLGVQIVVLALIARGAERIGRHLLETQLLVAVGVIAFVATVMGVPFWIVLPLAGLFVSLWRTRRPASWLVLAVGIAAAVAHQSWVGSDPILAPAFAPAGDAEWPWLLLAGLKAGLLTFGGAYAAIPFTRQDLVGRGWVEDGAFLDGVAFAGMLPAPLIIFCTFAGYVAGGMLGALAITAGVFLPAFAFSLLFYERLERWVEAPGLHGLLAGAGAAVVGLIGATLIALGRAVAESVGAGDRFVALLLLAAALAFVWTLKGRWVAPAAVVLGGLAGWAAFG
ncbi:MAG: chromate efflux transporter [Caulobacteraceae bacterium]|nr:chromate efflux transporter [Caulobacteraceae bacterium]